MPSTRRSKALASAALLALALSLSLALALFAAPAAPASFDRSVESIRRGFLGNDFMAIFHAYLLKPRGEYETTEQYEKRVSLLRGGDYAFRFKPENIKYDADERAFEVTIHTDPTYRGGVLESMSHTEFALMVGDKDLPQGHYIGSNAMGAKIRVEKDTETQFSITLPGDLITTNHTFLVPVDPGVAQKVKPTLGFLYVCHMAANSPDVASTAVVHISPAIDHPLERTLIFHYLSAENVELWAYSKITGKVFLKQSLIPGAKAPPQHDDAGFHRPAAAEAWSVCGEAVKSALAPAAITIPAYATSKLLKSDQDGNRNHFAFFIDTFDFFIDTSYIGRRPRIWTCSIDYENGVAQAPLVVPTQ